MKKSIAALGLMIAGTGLAGAFETAQSVTATPITALPFTITAPGNYFLPADLSFSGAGVAIVINANEVVLDLNGRSINATGAAASPNIGIGIAVLNHEDVIIQNGDINKFGYIGILLDATDGKREHNEKNRVEHVNFNSDEVGVLTVSSSIDVVEDCEFDGGSVGIYDIASLGGDRFQKDNFQNQQPAEALNAGFGVVSTPGKGVLIEDCVFADDHNGFIEQGSQDKFRFNTFLSDGLNHTGGTEEAAGDL